VRGLATACAALVATVGVLAILAFPLDVLDGVAPFWQYPVSDFAEHIIGGRYFLADAWRLPLLYVPDLGIPDGTNIGLTDSIPIVALVAKLARGLIDPATPYLPAWILVCCALQGPAAALALHAMGVRRVSHLYLGGLLLVFTPVLLARFVHAALCGQFVLLLALALLIKAGRSDKSSRVLAWYTPLLVLVLLVHIYLFAMVFAIMVAALLQALWDDRLTVRGAAALLGSFAIAVGLVMAVCGYLSLGPIPMKPYGESALNLAAPFLPGFGSIIGWSGLPPDIGFESYAWPGSGIVLLLVASAILWRQQLPTLWRAHFPTLVTIGALMVLAASYAVRVGPVLVLGIDAETVRHAVLGGGNVLHALMSGLTGLDDLRIGLYLALLGAAIAAVLVTFLRFVVAALIMLAMVTLLRPRVVALVLSNFQASARFVWVLLYLLALLAIGGVCRALRPGAAVFLLVAALCLQVWDTVPLVRSWQVQTAAAAEHPADEAELATAMQAADRIMLVPNYLCAFAEPLPEAEKDALIRQVVVVQVVASRRARPINSVRHSRMTATDLVALSAACSAQRASILAHAGDPGVLTFVFDDAPDEAAARAALAGRPECRALRTGVLCLAGGGER